MLALCVFGSDSAGAAPVGREKAAAAAEAFWNSVPETKSSCAVLKFVDDSRAAAAGIPAYYIFENVAGSGFVIISGDDNLPPVLGYSFESSLGEGDFPPNFREWLDYMSLAANSPSALSVSGWTAPHAGSPVVDLQTARWNQTAPYNSLCPKSNGVATYTGCTATALAIVMRHHRWPVRGTGTIPGYTASSGVTVPSITLGHEYDWDNMLMEYGWGCSDEEEEAVAELMRDCAVMIVSNFMPINSAGTGASSYKIPEAVVKYMGYDKSAYCTSRSAYSQPQWLDMLKNELSSGRPIVYSGI